MLHTSLYRVSWPCLIQGGTHLNIGALLENLHPHQKEGVEGRSLGSYATQQCEAPRPSTLVPQWSGSSFLMPGDLGGIEIDLYRGGEMRKNGRGEWAACERERERRMGDMTNWLIPTNFIPCDLWVSSFMCMGTRQYYHLCYPDLLNPLQKLDTECTT